MKRTQIMVTGACLALSSLAGVEACTGISFKAADGSFVVARTIEWAGSPLKSEYTVVPRGSELTSYTPTGVNGLKYNVRYGFIGLSVVEPGFVAEGINEAGLSAGLFYFPHYGSYEAYNSSLNDSSIADLQLVQWMLSQFGTIDEVIAALPNIHIISLDSTMLTLHWRIAEPSGRQVVLEVIDGKYHIHENKIGVITNAPEFTWHLTNLNNYVNLYPGVARPQKWNGVELSSISAGSAFHGIPGDVSSPSRFVRAAFFVATAPQRQTAFDTVLQCFHILNNFDVPVGSEHNVGETYTPMPSATQWTVVSDLAHRRIYYRTAYNSNIRCIDLKTIDFDNVKMNAYPLDTEQKQPIEMITIKM